jgi:hypothetical protein
VIGGHLFPVPKRVRSFLLILAHLTAVGKARRKTKSGSPGRGGGRFFSEKSLLHRVFGAKTWSCGDETPNVFVCETQSLGKAHLHGLFDYFGIGGPDH